MNNTTFETGATTHAINDLILFAENTPYLATLRDSIYERYCYGFLAGFSGESLKPTVSASFAQLLQEASDTYRREFPKWTDHKHIMPGNLTKEQKQEFCDLYAQGLEEYRAEKERN